MSLKKRVASAVLGLALFAGAAVPNASAAGSTDTMVTATLLGSGGFMIGLGIATYATIDEDKYGRDALGIGCFVTGGLLIIGGLWYGLSNDVMFAKAEQNEFIQHVSFNTTGKDFSLGAKFKY